MPSASSISKGDWTKPVSSILSNVQKVAITDRTVFGQTSSSPWPDGPVAFFFSLDLSSGEIRKFDDEVSLRKYAPQMGPLRSPDEAFRLMEDTQHSALFWPGMMSLPFALFAGGLYLIRRVRKESPH
jgi:hypothetical protein